MRDRRSRMDKLGKRNNISKGIVSGLISIIYSLFDNIIILLLIVFGTRVKAKLQLWSKLLQNGQL